MIETQRSIIGGYHVAAQIHSHPKPPKKYHNDFPSMDPDYQGGDRIAFELFGYPEMYIIPSSWCEGTNPIIKITDETTWCPDHPYK